MEQGDGYCDDVCACVGCKPQVTDPQHIEEVLAAVVKRQSAAIEDLLYLAGYLPEALQVLEKHGLR